MIHLLKRRSIYKYISVLLILTIILPLFTYAKPIAYADEIPPEPLSEDTFTISYVVNGGEELPNDIVVSGATFEPPTPKHSEGYIFERWYLDAEFNNYYDSTITISENITLYAKWSNIKHTHNVYYYYYIGGEVDECIVEIYEYGTCFTRPDDRLKDDYRLVGWYLDPSYQTPYTFDQPLTSDLYLYAYYIPTGNDILAFILPSASKEASIDYVNHTVTFYFDTKYANPDITNLSPEILVSPGASISPASGVSRDFTNPVTYTVTSGEGVSQVWTIKCEFVDEHYYYVQHYGQDQSGSVYNLVETQTFHAPVGTTVNAIPKSMLGYTYNANHKDQIVSGVIPESGILTLKLYYDREICSVKFEENGGPDVDDLTVMYGGTIIPPTIHRDNFTFCGWYRDSGFYNAFDSSAPVYGNLILYAKWEINKFNINYYYYETDGSFTTVSESYDYGTVFGRPADVYKEGYTFFGWYTDPSFQNKYNFDQPLSSDMNLYAVYKRNEADIKSFTVAGQYGSSVIDDVYKTVVFYFHTDGTIPNIKNLTPVITISDGAIINPASGEAVDFSSPVVYTVTAEAGDIQVWTVSCEYTGGVLYTVEHYRQDVDDSGYTLYEREELREDIGTDVTASPKTYIGFNENTTHPQRVSAGKVDMVGLVLKLYYDRELYTVRFEENGGTELEDLTGVRYGATINPPTNLQKEDYTFAGWYTNSNLTQEFNPANPITGDLTLYAKWVRGQYTVYYYDMDGTLLLQSKYPKDMVFGQPQLPVKEGYALMGWYLDPIRETLYGFDQPITKDMILYAIYKRNVTDIISFEVPGQYGSSVIDYENHTIVFYMHTEYAQPDVLIPYISISEGATIRPSSGEIQDFSVPVVYMVTAEAGNKQEWTVSCVYTGQYLYTVEHYQQDVDGSGYTLYEREELREDIGTDVTASPKTYIGFNENTTHPQRVSAGKVDMVGLVLKLYYDRELYTVRFEENGGTQLEDIIGVRYGATINPPTGLQKEDYIFGGWYTDSELSNEFNSLSPIAGELTLYAKWIRGYYTVSYCEPDGTVLLQNKHPREAVFSQPQAPIKEGYTFMGWYLEPTLDILYSFDKPITSDMSLYAMYKHNGVDIISFTVAGQYGSSVIDNVNHTVVFYLHTDNKDTDIKSLSPEIAISEGAIISPASGTEQDFSSPVVYTVTAEAGNKQEWTISCEYTGGMLYTVEHYWQDVEGTGYTLYETEELIQDIGSTVSAVAKAYIGFKENPTHPQRISSGKVEITGLVLRLYYDREQYSISFEENGGTQLEDITGVRYGAKINPPTTIQKDDYKFIGWYTNRELTKEFDSSLPVDKDYILYAKWERSRFYVNYYCYEADGSFTTVTESYDFGTIFKRPVDLVKEGYTLDGWYLEPTMQTLYDFDRPITSDMSLYAKYKKKSNDAVIVVPVIIPVQEEVKQEEKSDTVEPIGVLTVNASSIEAKSASLNGVIVSGGQGIIQVGFRYRAKNDSNWLYTVNQSLTLKNGDTFTIKIDGLKSETEYLFEARAANSQGLANGGIVSFTTLESELPTVSTLGWRSEELGKIQLNGTITDDGGGEITDAGFLWEEEKSNINKLSLGKKKGNFSGFLQDLDIGKTYFYQAYASSEKGTAFGKRLTFKVPGIVVTTLDAVDITKESATLQGMVSGDDEILECGFILNPSVKGDLKATVDSEGYFKIELKGLKEGETYYFNAYANTADGTFTGDTLEFIADDELPTVETSAVGEYSQIYADLRGLIIDDKGFEITEKGFYIGLTPKPNIMVIANPTIDIKQVAFWIYGLDADTTYYYRAFASNEKGIGFGKVLSFTTLKPVVPQVMTTNIAYDNNIRQWVFNGSIEFNGGSPILEYGFKYSQDKKSWIDVPVGLVTQGSYVLRGLPDIDKLAPGTYYIKAYAVNSVGVGEGEVKTFTIPKWPKVTTGVDMDSIDGNKVTLLGKITDTGGEGVVCHTTQFSYRKVGDIEWIAVGLADGNFTLEDFSFELTGLEPGQEYECVAEVGNSYGYGRGKIVTFVMNYGKTAQQAIEYFRGTEKDLTKICNILHDTYKCSLEELVDLLTVNEYTLSDITKAVKDSKYKANQTTLALIYKERKFTALEISEVLVQHYLTQKGAKAEQELHDILLECLFNLPDIMQVMISLYGYDIHKCYSKLYIGSLYSKDQVYKALADKFGLSELARYHVSEGKKKSLSDIQLYGELVKYMRDTEKLDPIKIGEILSEINPEGEAKLILNAFYNEAYALSDIIPMIMYLFGTDPFTLAAIISSSYYSKEDINDFFINTLECTAVQMIQIITNYYRTTKIVADACADVLKNYYRLNAVEAAKVLYAAGWTEKSGDKYANLGQLTLIMQQHYGQTSDYDLIGIYKAIGLAPLDVALRVGGKAGWLKDYKAHGYTASDAALWAQEEYKRNGLKSQIGATVKQCYEVGYDLIDIAIALRTVYKLSMQDAHQYILSNTKLDSKTINEALETAYGEDPIAHAIQTMKGQSIRNIARALLKTYKLENPSDAVSYLKAAGYEGSAILQAIAAIYFECRTKEQFKDYLEFTGKSFPDSSLKEYIDTIIRLFGNEPNPSFVLNRLLSYDYDIETIIIILRDEYRLETSEVIDTLVAYYGKKEETKLIYKVFALYCMDPVDYIRDERLKGTNALQSAKIITDRFGYTDVEKIAAKLAEAGYDKEDVLNVILELRFYGRLSAEAVEIYDKVLRLYYGTNSNDLVRILLTKNGQLCPYTEAISDLKNIGYGIDQLVKILKELYNLTAETVVMELTTKFPHQLKEITEAVQVIYNDNYLLTMIKYYKGQANATAESVYRDVMRETGITDHILLYKNMLYAGYAEDEVIEAMKAILFDDIYPVLEAIYGDKDIVIRNILKNGEIKPVSVAIKLLEQGGYQMEDMASALKDIYGLSNDEAISELSAVYPAKIKEITQAVETVYGSSYLLFMIKYWKSRANATAESVYRNVMRETGITDHALLYNTMLMAGYNEYELIEAMRAILFEGIYPVLKAIYNSTDTEIRLILRNGEVKPISDAIKLLNSGGYQLKDIATALSSLYGLSADEIIKELVAVYPTQLNDITKAVQAASGNGYLLMMITYWKSRPNSTAERVYRDVMREAGITDHVLLYNTMLEAGYSEYEVIAAMQAILFDGIFPVLKAIYSNTDDEVRVMLQNGELQPISDAIRLMENGGYSLRDIAAALNNVYDLTENETINEMSAVYPSRAKEISEAVQAVFGGNYLVSMIKYWRSFGINAAEIYSRLQRESGVTDDTLLYKAMLDAGFTEKEVIKAIDKIFYHEYFFIIKAVYDIKNTAELAEILAPHFKDKTVGGYIGIIAEQLLKEFPEDKPIDIVKALQAFGYPADEGESIEMWLYVYAPNGIKDEELAEYLGKPGEGLGLPTRKAVDIIYRMGFDEEEAIKLLINAEYSWGEFFYYMVHTFVKEKPSREYGANPSSAYFLVKKLRGKYKILDITEGLFGMYDKASTVLRDLTSGGYTIEEALHAIMWMGKGAVSSLMSALCEGQSRMSAKEAATLIFTISAIVGYEKMQIAMKKEGGLLKNLKSIGYLPTLEDIAQGLVDNGEGETEWYMFSYYDMLDAMMAVVEKYNELYEVEDNVSTMVAALNLLKRAGAAPTDAASMLAAHRVGISTLQIIKSFIGIDQGILKAVSTMASAGYSFFDTINAIFNNKDYRNVLGVSILSQIAAYAAQTLSIGINMEECISTARTIARIGFIIGEGDYSADRLLSLSSTYRKIKMARLAVDIID